MTLAAKGKHAQEEGRGEKSFAGSESAPPLGLAVLTEGKLPEGGKSQN